MIKSYLNKVLAFLFAVLVLFSTLSISVEKHFCGDYLVDVALFTSVEKCNMDSHNEPSNHEDLKRNCCKDVVETFSSPSEYEPTSNNKLIKLQKQFFNAFVITYVSLFREALPKKTIPFKTYQNPHLVVDITVLDQVFLI